MDTATDPLISCRQARATGQAWYFTGVPCLRGHTSRRATVNGTCAECNNIKRRLALGRKALSQSNEEQAWSGRFSCAAEIDAYVGRDTIECLICRVDGFGLLSPHLKRRHGLSADEYRDRFGISKGVYLSSAASRAKRDKESVQIARRRKQAERASAQDWDKALARIRAGALVSEVLTGRDGMPSRSDYSVRRRKDASFRAESDALTAGRAGGRLTEAEEQIIVKRLKAGESIEKIAPTLPVPRCASWIGRRRLFIPAFAAQTAPYWNPTLRLAPERRAARLALLRERQLDRSAPQRHREEMTRHLRQDELYGAVEKAVPRYLPPFVRDDIKSELVLDLLMGAVQIGDLAREVKRHVAGYNRMFDPHARSLDAEMGEGGFTLGNSLAAAYV